MPLILTQQDWDELWEADSSSTETIEYPDPFEVRRTSSSSFSQGWSRDIRLRDLWLNIEESQVPEDLIFKSEIASWGPSSSFFVTGTMKSCHLGLTDENLEPPDCNYLECIQGGAEIDQQFAKENVLRVRCGIQPDALNQFGESLTLPRELQPLANGNAPDSFYRQGKTTPDMQMILYQILYCPYQGAIKQMYLEGKVLELVALQFAQFTEIDPDSQQETMLKADEIERLYHAREILMRQFEHPPSILSLARQVGLNDFKLKQGFRQLFGTTVFGYLRDYRLEQARFLLMEGELTVQQVTRAIGYTHSGYFAKAFKHKFGVSPKAYQSTASAKVMERV